MTGTPNSAAALVASAAAAARAMLAKLDPEPLRAAATRAERDVLLLRTTLTTMDGLPRGRKTFAAIEAAAAVLTGAWSLPDTLRTKTIQRSSALTYIYRAARFRKEREEKVAYGLRSLAPEELIRRTDAAEGSREADRLRITELEQENADLKIHNAAEVARAFMVARGLGLTDESPRNAPEPAVAAPPPEAAPRPKTGNREKKRRSGQARPTPGPSA